jgi:hypothetical protein
VAAVASAALESAAELVGVVPVKPVKFRFDEAANGLAAVVAGAAAVDTVPRAAAAFTIEAEFGSAVGAAVLAAPAVAGAAAVAGPIELNVLRPPGSIVDISFTPPKKLMLL